MKNRKRILTAAFLATVLTLGLASCGGGGGTPGNSEGNSETSVETSQGGTSNETSEATSAIKELTAVSESTELKVGEQVTVSNYYKLVGYKSLTAKQKKVTVVSSNPAVIEVASTYKTMTALSIGEADITVTSSVDETKICTFKVVVTDSFFDRSVSSIASDWDFSNEMDETSPSIKITSDAGNGVYIKNSDGLKWFVETDITIHSVDSSEQFPKFGIVANTTTNTTEVNNNKVYFFIDCPMSIEGNWTNYGVCEVSNGTSWAWNPGVANNTARHNDTIHTASSPIGYEKTFKLGMIRDGFNCHFYVDGVYVKSATILGTIFGNYNATTQDYTDAANTMAGFFLFKASATFSNYSFTNDAAVVDGMISAITPSYITWADD